MRRLFARETILCALGLLPGSVIVMARLPPLWRGIDGLNQIASPPGNVTLLCFPALYPFLSRLPILLVSAWRNAGHLYSLQLGVKRWVALNDAGLLLLVAGQQLALLFALALLTVSCARRPILRCLIVVVFLCNPVLFIGAQLISSEALASILLILLIAIAIELSRRQELSRNGIIALGVCLYANVMTRHLNMIYAALFQKFCSDMCCRFGCDCCGQFNYANLVRCFSGTVPFHCCPNSNCSIGFDRSTAHCR